MYRPLVCGALCLMLTAIGAVGCSDDTGTPPTQEPPPAEISEIFEGTLTINGAVIYPFTVTGVGSVNAIVNDLTPNTPEKTLSIGLDLGTWNGTSCEIRLSNANAGLGGGVAGVANGLGDLCARAYDVGKLTEPITFKIAITHF